MFEIENIDKYDERFIDHIDNKKHKGLKKSTPDMDFDSYSNCLSDLTEYYGEFLKKPTQEIEQRFQVINESMQMKSVCKVQFGQLNDKRFYIHTVIQSKKDKFLKEKSKVIQKIQRLNILKQIYSQVPLL